MKFFTEKEDRFIRNNYLKIPTKRMSKMLGRADSVVGQRMKRIGIVVPKEIVEARKKESQYKKGIIPFNKGKKMRPDVYERCAATMFKKGQQSINKKPVGSKRIDKDGYHWTKVKNPRKWRMTHVIYWEKWRGKVPKNRIVIFKDKNKSNIKMSNLMLISRQDHMRRNSFHRYGKEIAKTIQLMGALTRQINKHEKHPRPARTAV